MAISKKVCVTSIAFSTSETLRRELQALHPEVAFNDDQVRFDGPGLKKFLDQADAAIIGLDAITPELIKALPNLKYIAKYGVGLDNIHEELLDYKEFGIGWTPGVNRRSVSELALSFILGLKRNVFQSGFQLKQGSWQKNGGTQLTGNRVAIIGCGHIGTDLLHLLQPFDVDPMIVDIEDKREIASRFGGRQVTFEEALKTADIVSLHVPLTKLTHGMIDSKSLAMMKPHAILINTCRGAVVRQADLKAALIAHTIAGAALDVFEVEPPTDQEFLNLPQLMVTPHIGGNSQEAVLAMGRSAISHIEGYLRRHGEAHPS